MFDPNFSFEDADVPSLPGIVNSHEIINPGRRLVDNLIEQYRQEKSHDDKDTDCVEPSCVVVSKIQDQDHHEFTLTDVIRAKKNRLRKTKPESDKYVFKQAVEKYREVSSFIELRLSKPLLKSLTEMSLDKPLPIQCACIPVALLNRDICACARTGSGKTLAFMLPILERLTKKPFTMGKTLTRALIVSPTRELAVQIFRVAEKLVKYCSKIRVQLAAGGLDLLSQEASLRQNPDLVIATPGRLIDHISNAPSFSLHQVEYLVLDEADKLLDEYFVEQIGEIVRHCGKQRQTLLFSATMTESVKELATLSLKDPVQVFLNQVTAVAQRLQQEFVRVRPHRENDRPAILASMLVRSFNRRCIVFMPTKKDCHRMHITLSLLGLRCAELHGDMTQPQRLDALRRFSDTSASEPITSRAEDSEEDVEKGKSAEVRQRETFPPVDILLATDLVARGLDIPNVETVINYNLPQTLKQYIHRVGRTARASKAGRAVSLVGEADRKLLKEIMKEAPYPVQSRVIPPEIIEQFHTKLAKLEETVNEILAAEQEEKEFRAATIQLEKAEKFMTEGPMNSSDRCGRVDWFRERRSEKRFATRGTRKKSQFERKKTRRAASDSE